MRKNFKLPLYFAMGALFTASMVACSDSDDDGDSIKEDALGTAIVPYVNNTVIGTYTKMADASIDLYEKCVIIKDAYTNKTLTSEMVKSAGESWNTARKYWELSEAFLYGAAADYNIDPHIDSWPLDKATMESTLNNAQQMQLISEKGAGILGYGLLGFHAVEYMLFQLDSSETKSEPRDINKYNTNELIYLVAVAEDLRNQCVRLEASWAGTDNITAAKQQILEDAELEPTFNYGESMLASGQAGSKYKNFLAAAQDIIQGCIDIADEVGNQKIGRPVNGSSEDDKNYIESPYSLNSIVDFTDNIISIKNSYEGINSGDASISDYIKSVDPTLDTKVKASIQAAIDIIGKIPEPFAKNASTNADAKKAVTVVGTDLVKTLEEVAQALSKY